MNPGSHSFLAAAFVLGLALWSGAAQAQAVRRDPPMTVYPAKGSADACGLGCSEWIAAEGAISVGSATHLRAVLGRLGKQKLPVVFDSPGGLREESLAIGRLLREKGLTATVGRTNPKGCADENKAKECRDLKNSDKKPEAELQTHLASCNSACVYALMGAKVRVVSPGTRLGIHSSEPTLIYPDGRTKILDVEKLSRQQRAGRQQSEEKLRSYVREMGIDVRFIDEAKKTPHNKIYYLTRDQIAEFGIDRSEFQETPWWFNDNPFNVPSVSKFFLEAKAGPERKEFPTSHIQFMCGGGSRVAFFYKRGLPADGSWKVQVDLSIGPASTPIGIAGIYKHDWIENERSFDSRIGETNFAFLESASGNPIEIVETSSVDTEATPHVIKLSSLGWSEAVGKLRNKCAGR